MAARNLDEASTSSSRTMTAESDGQSRPNRDRLASKQQDKKQPREHDLEASDTEAERQRERERGPKDIVPNSEGVRPATEEPPLQTGHANLKQDANKLPPTEIDSMYKPLYGQWTVHSFLLFGSFWGILTRLGMQWIGGFASSQVFALIWAQMVGCFVMGFSVRKKNEIERVFPPFFVMIGTGYCGSVTTWSTMSNDIFTAYANLDEPAGTSRFTAFLSGMAILLITLAAVHGAFQVGIHLAITTPMVSLHPRRAHRSEQIFNLATVLIGPVMWLGGLFLLIFGPHDWRTNFSFAIVVGPFGAIARYHISRLLNPISSTLPYGTLFCNTLSTGIVAVMSLLAYHPRSALGCAALKGVIDGFCGSLSTISTMVVELRGLSTWHSYRYILVSYAAAQCMLVVILGSWVWSGDRAGLCWKS
ncbi:hypothetical protein JCM10908_005066 [Rhodotorula pacifica]|uniref:FluC/FEX family fluoride channel n=1 Tax=Rhodotorula pacifica TaxID=1495444 RepID=UPI00316AFAD5